MMVAVIGLAMALLIIGFLIGYSDGHGNYM